LKVDLPLILMLFVVFATGAEQLTTIYLIGSLRNPEVPKVGNRIRKETGLDIFDDWWSASDDADDWLRDYYKGRSFSYKEAIHSYAAKHIFEFDLHHLDRCDGGILLLPSGKSGHMEMCYLRGQGKPAYILFDKEPERVDIMYNFATDIFFNIEDLINELRQVYGNGSK